MKHEGAAKQQRLPLVWRSIIISLCSLPPPSPPCLCVCVSVRGVHDTGLVSVTQSVHSPRPFKTFLFLVSFFLGSAGLWRSRAAWRRRQRIRLPHYCGQWRREKNDWGTLSLPASSPAPTCSLSASNPPTCGALQVIFSIYFLLRGQEGVTALLREVWNALVVIITIICSGSDHKWRRSSMNGRPVEGTCDTFDNPITMQPI